MIPTVKFGDQVKKGHEDAIPIHVLNFVLIFFAISSTVSLDTSMIDRLWIKYQKNKLEISLGRQEDTLEESGMEVGM